jgi:hypothetical protein
MNKDLGEDWLVGAKFFSRNELRELNVFPEILKDQFWDDLKEKNKTTRYLGLERLLY